MRNKLFIVGLVGIMTLGSIGVAVAAPNWIFQQTLLPIGNAGRDLGTTTSNSVGSGVWRTLYVNLASTTNLIVSGLGGASGCLTPGADGTITTTACSGGGGGTGAATSSFAATAPITLTTSASAITYGFSGLATTSQPASSNVLTSNGAAGVYGTATTSVACSGTVSCTGFNVLGASPITITGSGGGTGTVSTSTNETAGRVPYWTTTSGTPAKLGEVATTTLALTGFPANQSGTLGTLLGGTNTSFTYWGLATSSNIAAASGLIYATGANTVASISTSSAVSMSITGNAGTATALAGNGTNCAAGFFPLGVDASGISETCTYAFATTTPWTTGLVAVGSAGAGYTIASSTLFGYTPLNPTRQLTIAGTANQITSSAGAQDLSADRTWTLSHPSHMIQNSILLTQSSTTNATTTGTHYFTGAFASTTKFFANGLTTCQGGFMVTYDGAGTFGCEDDSTAAGAADDFTFASTFGAVNAATSSNLWVQGVLNASSTSNFTATSTFYSGIDLIVGGVSSSESEGGVINCRRFANVGPCLIGHSAAGVGGGRMISLVNTNTAYDTQIFHASSSSLTESTVNVFCIVAGKGCIKATLRNGTHDSSAASFDASGSQGQALFAKGNAGTTTPIFNVLDSDSNTAFRVDGYRLSTLIDASTTQLTISGNLYFDGLTFDSLTDDATLDNNSGDLRVVDVTCTGCLGTTEIAGLDISDDTNLAVTWPVIKTDDTLSFGGLSTSSPIAAASGLLYATGVNTLASISTSSAISMSITGNSGTATALAANGANCAAGYFPLGVDASGVTENCTYAFATTTPWSTGLVAVGSAGAGYTIASSTLFGYTPEQPLTFTTPLIRTSNTVNWVGLATTSQPSSSNVLTSNGGSGVYGTATSSYAVTGFPANLSGTLGAFVGGANSTWTYWGLATTSQPASSNLLVSNGGAGVYGVATTSVTCTGSASCTAFTVLGASPITINATGGGGADPAWATTSPYAGALVLYPADQTNEDVVFGSNAGSTTTAPFWWDVSATSTYIGNGGAGSSTMQLGSAGNEWIFGTNTTGKNFVIGSSTMLEVNPALTINKTNLLVTVGYASSTALSGTTLCIGTDCRTSWPAAGGSSAVATSTNETKGQLSYWTSTSGTPATLGVVSTTTLAFSGPFNGTSALGALVGGSNSTVSYWGLSTSTALTGGRLLYSDGTKNVTDIATTTLTLTSFPANFTGTLGTLVGGTNSSWTYWGLATTSQPSSSNLLVSNGAAGVYGVATTSITCTGLLSCTSFAAFGAASSFNLAAAAANTVLVNGTGGSAVPTFQATSTFGTNLYGNGTPGQVLMWSGSAPVWAATSTGSAGSAFAWTPGSYGTQGINATSTGLWLKGTPLSLIATSTFTTYASTTQMSIGEYGAAANIYFTQDGDGALTIQGIGNANNQSYTQNLDDTAGANVISSGSITAFDFTNIRLRNDGIVIDGDGTYPASVNGSIIMGDGTDDGTFEAEDASGCFGDGGCTPHAQDGSLTIATYLGVGTSTFQSALATFASSTAPQIALSDALGSMLWTMRNINGYLYFATSTFAATSTPAAITVNGNAGSSGLFVGTTTNAAATGLAVAGKWFSTGLTAESGAGDVLCIKSNGEIVQDTSPLTACSGASSIKVKHGVETLSANLSTILAMRPVSYIYNEDYSPDQSVHLGFVAEEIEAIEPRLVDVPSGDGPKGLKYNEFVAPIVGAIQELYHQFQGLLARVSGLEEKFETQQTEIDELRARLEALEYPPRNVWVPI